MARPMPDHLSGFTKLLRKETYKSLPNKAKTDSFVTSKVNEKLHIMNLTEAKNKPKRCLSSGVATRHYRAPELIILEPEYD